MGAMYILPPLYNLKENPHNVHAIMGNRVVF